MMRSCSAWMVSTMSRIRPVRVAVTAASSADSLASSRVAASLPRRASCQVEHLVVDADHRRSPGADVAPAADPVRRGGGGQVERPGRRGAPVHQHRLVVTVVVEDPDPADVAGGALAKSSRPKHSPLSTASNCASWSLYMAIVVSRSERACGVPPVCTKHAASRFAACSRIRSSRPYRVETYACS